MRLEAVAAHGGLAVVAHGERQEVELDVGIVDAGGGAQEGRALELVRGTEAAAQDSHCAPISAFEMRL